MSTIILKKHRDQFDLLERMLNSTTLTTQRVTHRHILKAGEGVMKENFIDVDGEKAAAVREALIAADKRHGRELKAACFKLEKELEEERTRALQRQQRHYEELANRVAGERDKAEEQRRREIHRKFTKEKEEALAKQWEEAERLKAIAVQEACEKLQHKVRGQFIIEREKAMAEALTRARERFKLREQETIARTQRECAKQAKEEAEKVAERHAEELEKREKRYDALITKYQRELQHKARVEQDFMDLQTDYKRFMDYTDSQFHSDYMMRLRCHGLGLSNKRVSLITYEDVKKLDG